MNASFYIRYDYAYVLVNGRRMGCYNKKSGSPWKNNFATAERWLNQKENNRENLDNIERPNTKWVFVRFLIVGVKVVLDRQAVSHGPVAGLAAQPCSRSRDGSVRHFLSLVLHSCSPRGTRRSEHTVCERVSKELL